MRSNTLLTTLLGLSGLALSGCGTPQPATGGGGGGGACDVCHGDPARKGTLPGTDANLTAAPPAAPAGAPDSVVGAHQAHLNPGATGSLRGPIACAECHVVPTNSNHASNPPAQIVVFSGVALGPSVTTDGTNPGMPTWNGASTPTCSSVYCHGSFQWFGNGQGGADVLGSAFTPDWTKGSGQAACGTCHALPPSGHITNAFIAADPTNPVTCNGCHGGTVDPAGNIIIDPQTGVSLHINGEINEGAHTDPNWAQPTVHGYAAIEANGGLQHCVQCHTGFDSPLAPPPDPANSCNACHATALSGAATPDWQHNCVFCHGDKSKLLTWSSVDPIYEIAPPVGPLGEPATTAIAVGAHQQHVGTLNVLSNPFACTECHPSPMPADITHVNGGPVPVPLSGPIATAAGTVQGTWNLAPPTCSATYCHGNFPGGNQVAPTWTQVDGTFAACTSCHGAVLPSVGSLSAAPNDGQHDLHLGPIVGAVCNTCHPTAYSYSAGAGTVDPTIHVNGVINLGASSTFGTFSDWNPNTVGTNAAYRGTATGCHGGANHWFGPAGGNCR